MFGHEEKRKESVCKAAVNKRVYYIIINLLYIYVWYRSAFSDLL